MPVDLLIDYSHDGALPKLVRLAAIFALLGLFLLEGRWTPPKVRAAVSVLSRLVRAGVLVMLTCSFLLLYPTLERAVLRIVGPQG